MTYRAWALAGSALFATASWSAAAFAQVSATPAPTGAAPATSLGGVPILTPAAQAALQKAVAGTSRIEPARDRWRNPAATLQFFGVRPTDTVVEIWPGQGWYTSIIGPYLKQGGGRLVVGHFDAASTNSSVVRQIVDAYRARFASDQGTYGNVSVVPFGPLSGPLGSPGTADSVLTFRNVHNWMAQGWAEKAFGDFFIVLKPGGILGIEEHRGRTDEPQDPLARDGYVREDFVIQMAREAGFEFVGRSEINANPADTKDHPFGVWTLPPVSRTSPLGQRDDPGFDRTRYDAIGESDRMTLRFRKPLTATSVPASGTGRPLSPVIVNPALPVPVAPPRPVLPPPIVRPPIPKVVAPITPPTPVAVKLPPPPVPAPVVPPTPVVPPPAPVVVKPPPPPVVATPLPPVALPPPPVTPPPVVATPLPPVALPPPPVTPPPVIATPLPPVALPPPPVTPPPVVATPLPPVALPPPPVTPPPPVVRASPPPVSPPPVTRPASPPPAVRPAPPPPAARPASPPPRPAARPASRPPPAVSPPPATRPRAAPPTPPRPAARPVVRPPPPPVVRRPPPRPAPPPPKKKAPPPPPRDPNKPDWVVPRARS